MFPAREREQGLRVKLLTLAQDHMRSVVDVIRKTSLMMEYLCNDEPIQKLEETYADILKSEEKARDTRRIIEDEVTNVGALLTNREDFLRLIHGIDRIGDTAEGVAFRILSLARAKLKINKDVAKNMCVLSDSVLHTVMKLREALLAVTLNHDTFSNKLKEIEESERAVDDHYRNLDLAILQSEMRIPQLLLSREIVSMLEDIADRAEETVETLRVLSFVIL
ncbi:MAG: DUF47 family protein [Aigarchaeota archaeon]|nr:DUF47 family protein [Candidatus Pelearchaeum maunauluense]